MIALMLFVIISLAGLLVYSLCKAAAKPTPDLNAVRKDAIKRSQAVNKGLCLEQFAPHLTGFPYDPKDCHFIGKPFDYLILDGLSKTGQVKQVVLLEVKSGKSALNQNEKAVRDAVLEGRVNFGTFRV